MINLKFGWIGYDWSKINFKSNFLEQIKVDTVSLTEKVK